MRVAPKTTDLGAVRQPRGGTAGSMPIGIEPPTDRRKDGEKPDEVGGVE
jgi:hypothetical protein